METTEKYEIIMAFVSDVRPTREYLEEIWNTAILEEFKKSGTYVNVMIDERSLICVDCPKDEQVYVITSIRNPQQTPDQDAYYNSLGNILFKVRELLDSPYTLISIDTVYVSFFPYHP